MGEEYILILNDQEIPIQFNSKLVLKLGENISDTLISSKKYFVKSKVKRNNFDIFLDFLNSKIENPSIDSNNYYDYFQLSKEFNNILSDYLSKPEFDEICKISMLNNAIINENSDKQLCESYISENLDYYIQYHKNNLSKIPYTTLYNIFQHKKRVLNNHENAYQFIKHVLNESNSNNGVEKKNICVLLGTLEGNKLNEESLKESISKKEEHFGFVPKIESTIFNSFNNIVSDLKIQLENKYKQTVNDLMEKQIQLFNDFKVYFDSKFDSIKTNNENFTKEIKETKNLVTNLSEKIQNIENNIKQMSNKNDDAQNKIQNIISQVDDLKNNQNQILQKCDNNNSLLIQNKITGIENNINQISNTNNDIQNKIQSMTNQINEIKTKNIQISQQCDNTYNSIQQIPNKINCIESDTKKIFSRVSETLDISIARFGLFRGIIHQMTEECGGNVSDKGRVNVTSSSYRAGNLPKYAVDLDNNQTCFESDGYVNSWLKYDFISRKIRPSYYSIRSRNTNKGDHHPMNWVIEGSNTDYLYDWSVLDTRNNITSLDDSCASQIFSIQKTDTFYRYLRIRQTGLNSANRHYLEISALEYFGSVQ